jgi:hypothetical protein
MSQRILVETPVFTVYQSGYMPPGELFMSAKNSFSLDRLVELSRAVQAQNQFPRYDDILAWHEVRP